MNKILLILLLFCSFTLFSQDENDEGFEAFAYNPKSKFGIRLGLGRSNFVTQNFLNPTALIGYTAGFYHHMRLADKHNFYYELGARFSGSNFNTSPDSITYSRVSLFYLELPVCYMFNISNNDYKPIFIMLGGGGRLLIKSSMLLGPDPIPKYFNLPLKRGDLFLMGGIHSFFGGMGLQLTAKIGLTDINKREWRGFETVKPSLDRNLPVRNFAIEMALIF